MRPSSLTPRRCWPSLLVLILLSLGVATPVVAQPTTGQPSAAPTPHDKEDESLPLLAEPINDFATVIDEPNRQALDRMARALQSATGDAIVVVTVPTFAPYGSIQEYAVKLFANHGRGIGQKGKDNGLLVVLAVNDRKVWIEVGYGLEGIITDGFSGETSRQYMAPYFRQGQYGAGLRAGVGRIIAAIAQERHVSLGDATPQQMTPPRARPSDDSGHLLFLYIIIAILIFHVLRAIFFGGGRGRGGWGRGGWSGWSGGVGGFGGGWGGGWGGGGGGGGGGWGGFGGGSSGGGGGGASW